MQPPQDLVIRTHMSYRVVKVVAAALLIFFIGGSALALLFGANLDAMLFPTVTMGSMLLFVPIILWLSIRGAASAERSRIQHFFNQEMWATWQYGDAQWQQIADERREMGSKVRGFAKGYAEAEAIRLSTTPHPRLYIASNGVYHEIDGFTSLNNVNKARIRPRQPGLCQV